MSSYKVMKTPGDTSWFLKDRFGMFIHFGLYAMPARHEWIKKLECTTEEHYDLYFKYFNPDLFDAKEWAKQAKAAGMKYAVLTAKHHEGFCLFDSKYTEYKVTNTPCGRDIVKEYADAFRAEGIRVGLYYSLLDWHHPEFTIDWMHPRRRDKDAEEQNKSRDIKKYAEYMRNQVTELLTNYGKIDILWFDFNYPNKPNVEGIYPPVTLKDWMVGKGEDAWESEKLISTIRTLQPDIIINNRTGIDQDIWTPEQSKPSEWVKHPETGELVPWECCQTFSGSWGYYRDEMSWKSDRMLIELLINAVSYGGNMIMNVGPTARGCFDERAENALLVYAKWMRFNGRSIYGCTMAEPEFKVPDGCKLTQSEDGKRIYIHLIEYPLNFLALEGFEDKIEYAQFLHDSSEILITKKRVKEMGDETGQEKEVIFLKIPSLQPKVTIPVIELFLK